MLVGVPLVLAVYFAVAVALIPSVRVALAMLRSRLSLVLPFSSGRAA
jgi:hypothetical protein